MSCALRHSRRLLRRRLMLWEYYVWQRQPRRLRPRPLWPAVTFSFLRQRRRLRPRHPWPEAISFSPPLLRLLRPWRPRLSTRQTVFRCVSARTRRPQDYSLWILRLLYALTCRRARGRTFPCPISLRVFARIYFRRPIFPFRHPVFWTPCHAPGRTRERPSDTTSSPAPRGQISESWSSFKVKTQSAGELNNPHDSNERPHGHRYLLDCPIIGSDPQAATAIQEPRGSTRESEAGSNRVACQADALPSWSARQSLDTSAFAGRACERGAPYATPPVKSASMGAPRFNCTGRFKRSRTSAVGSTPSAW